MADKRQLHKRLGVDQVKTILHKFLQRELTGVATRRLLGLGRTRFYEVVGTYQREQEKFSLVYKRSHANHVLSSGTQELILKELMRQKEQIEDHDIPLYRYNYTYAKDALERKEDIVVSVSTVSRLAHKYGYVKKRRKKNEHTKTVKTDCIGELVQHDASHHLFAPCGGKKWCLISSLDDCSRLLLHARFHRTESSYAHIQAVEDICLQYGICHSIYSDNHRIFRYVKSRDEETIWTTYTKFTDDVESQWKAVLSDLQIQTIYATSPQAKGKIERPYGWIQDRMVRRCIEEEVTTLDAGQQILDEERNRYNTQLVHSQTGEVPLYRFHRFTKEGKSLFRPFTLPHPFTSLKDVFALRINRQTDGYRRIRLFGHAIQLKQVSTYAPVEVRFIPCHRDKKIHLRFFHEKKFIGSKTVPSG